MNEPVNGASEPSERSEAERRGASERAREWSVAKRSAVERVSGVSGAGERT